MTAPDVVTRDDIEAKLRDIRADVEEGATKAKGYAVVAGAVVVVAVLGLGFWMGRRRGRKKTTIVEIQRV